MFNEDEDYNPNRCGYDVEEGKWWEPFAALFFILGALAVFFFVRCSK